MLKKKLKTKTSAKPVKKLKLKVKAKTSARGHQEPVVKKKLKKAVEAPKKKGLKSKVKAAPAKKTAKKKVTRAKAAPTMNKSQLIAYYMEKLDWDRGDVVAFLNAQEELLIRSLRKSGLFVLPGVIKIVAKKKPPQKMPAIKKGTIVKGFGGVEVESPGRKAFTKPASVRFGARGMKKLKDAVLGN